MIMVNPAFENTFGWTSRELAGRALDFLPDRLRDEALGDDGPAPAEGWDKSQFTKRLTRDGRVLDVLLSTAGFHDQYGNRVGTVVILRDVTQVKKAEEALKESERKFSTVFRLSPMAVAVVSMADGVLPGGERLLLPAHRVPPGGADRPQRPGPDPMGAGHRARRPAGHAGALRPGPQL